MKYLKKFKSRDNPRNIVRRIQIIKSYLKGKSLTAISKEENCTIKTVKKWVDR